MSGLRDSKQQVVLFADDGEPAADVAWAWMTSHPWAGWELQAVTGDPRVVLLGRSDASLMVVGCHQRGYLVGLWAGSTTEWLLVKPRTPMLIAHVPEPDADAAEAR